MTVDFMGLMRKCAHCHSPDDTVCWSDELDCYVCDECYEELMAIEDE